MTLFALLLACANAECTTESGATYASGEVWTCDDGCNTCACEDGAIASTLMACAETTCTAPDGTELAVGDTVTCADACNTCECTDDGTLVAITDRSCS